MADDDIYYGDVLRSDSPVYKDYENSGGDDVISGEDDGYEQFGSLGILIRFFTKSPPYKNANIANFVLAVPLEMNETSEVCNLEI